MLTTHLHLLPGGLPQVVSDYLTAYDDPAMMMQAGGKPVVVYTYRCGLEVWDGAFMPWQP